VTILRRLWTPRDGREPLSVPDALRRAELRRREGRYAEAGALVARALEIDAGNLHAHLLAAYLHVARRATAARQGGVPLGAGHDPNHARALLGLARIAFEERDPRTCHDLLRRALRFYPDFPRPARCWSWCAARGGAPAPVAPAAPRVERCGSRHRPRADHRA